jgi:hypothetical protein
MSCFCGTLVLPGERFTAIKRKAHPGQEAAVDRRRGPHVAQRLPTLLISFPRKRSTAGPVCQNPMRVIAVIDDPRVIEKTLRYLALWYAPPPSPPGPVGVLACRRGRSRRPYGTSRRWDRSTRLSRCRTRSRSKESKARQAGHESSVRKRRGLVVSGGDDQ